MTRRLSLRGWLMVVAAVTLLPASTLTVTPSLAGAAASSPVCGPMQHVLDANGQPVPPVDARQPVLLVHGFNGSPSSTWGGSGIADELEALGSGFFVGRFDYSYQDKLNQQWVTDVRISGTPTQPGQLADVIDCMAQESRNAGGAGKVIVVGYSLGGLAAQQAISEKVSGREVASDLGGLVSIGTPWQGLDPKFDLATMLTGYYCNALDPAVAIDPAVSGDACLLLTNLGLNSPAAQDVLTVPGRGLPAQLKNLPKIPTGFPVLAVAGNVIVTAQQLDRSSVYQGSDWVVSVSSATSPPLADGPGSGQLTTATISCHASNLPAAPIHTKTAAASPWTHVPLCFHVTLPAAPDVTAQVLPVLQQWRGSLARSLAAVDWNNRQYALTCGSTVHGPVQVVLHHGAATAQTPGLGPYDRWDVSIDQVAHGVLTPLGDVTAVLFSCSPQPSNFSLQELRIYRTASGDEIGKIPDLPANGGVLPGVYESGSVTIANGHVGAGVMFYGPGDSHASGPSVPDHLSWSWNGREFVIDTTTSPAQLTSCTVAELTRAISAANPTAASGWTVTKYACSDGYALVEVYLSSAGYGYAVLKQEPSGWRSVYGLDGGQCLFAGCPGFQLPLPAALLQTLKSKAGISY